MQWRWFATQVKKINTNNFCDFFWPFVYHYLLKTFEIQHIGKDERPFLNFRILWKGKIRVWEGLWIQKIFSDFDSDRLTYFSAFLEQYFDGEIFQEVALIAIILYMYPG
jgi:hypothetical protein